MRACTKGAVGDARAKWWAALNHCHQTIEIDATPEECFAAATGFEDYPKWAGAMKKVNVKQRQGRGLGTVVEWTMGILNLVDRPVFVYTYERSNTEMKWHIQTPSKTIKNLEGRYTFKSVGSAKAPKTKVEYKLNVEPYIPFPAFVKKVINKGKPCTLHPTPYTPHPTPYTLHPTP